MLSIIIPAFNEEGNITKIVDVIDNLMTENKIDYEIVFINDGSKDNSWQEICAVAEKNSNISAVNFSRNFGKESAIFAGLKYAKGDACVLIDCDLQHPPKKIVEMYRIWENNDVDIVEARKSSRGKENFLYKLFSNFFYKLIRVESGIDMKNTSDFKLMSRQVIDSLNEMPERLTFFRAMSSWVGFKTETIYFDVEERQIGKTKWSLRKLINYAISSITSYTSAPMQLVTVVGVITFIISVILGINTLYNKISGRSLEGFSTVILLQLFTSSVIMFSLGIIGYYLAKIYEEIKRRPRYIVNEVIESKKNQVKES
jgi:dolichol-phosphate mannosyltransferase